MLVRRDLIFLWRGSVQDDFKQFTVDEEDVAADNLPLRELIDVGPVARLVLDPPVW